MNAGAAKGFPKSLGLEVSTLKNSFLKFSRLSYKKEKGS